jgi:transposase
MLHLSPSCRYYLYRGDADMRKGFDSLSGIVNHQMQGNALSGAVFIFFNKRHTQVKLLHWEGDGFGLYHKRLEKGTYEIPVFHNNNTVADISNEQLLFILQGISLKHIRKRKRYQHQGSVC